MTKTKKNIFKVLLSFLSVFAFTFLFTVSVVFAADKKIEGLDTIYKNKVNDGNKITDLSKIEENTKIIIKLGDLKDKEVKSFKIGDKQAKFDNKNQYIFEKLENDLNFGLAFDNKKASPEKQSLPATTIAAIVILVIVILSAAVPATVIAIIIAINKKSRKRCFKKAKDLDSKSAETKAETETEEKASEETKEEK